MKNLAAHQKSTWLRKKYNYSTIFFPTYKNIFQWHWNLYYSALLGLLLISGWLLLSICRAVV